MSIPTILPPNTTPLAYQVELAIDLASCTYQFKTSLSLNLAPHTTAIRLHWIPKPNQPPIQSATFDGIVSNTATLDDATQTINFTFDQPLPPTGCLTIAGSSVLDDSLCGLYRSAYTDPHTKEKKYMAVTQFEATDARRCFPCIDEPSAKATFELTVLVDRKYDVVSNMPLKERQSMDAHSVRISFPKTPVMSTYLLALIVGEFDVISTMSSNGVRTSIFTPRGQSRLGQHALAVASKALPFFETQFGIKYPLPKSDLLAIPDFAAGAMENWGAVTYRESRLLIDPSRTSLSLTTRCTRTVCHELAHMWFGNYVTMAWWTQLWLNEGFARFMEFKAVHDQFPEWNIWQQFLYSVQGLAFDRDGMKTTHPVEQQVNHPKEIDQMFDVISYAKGASVLRMLHEWLGEETFMSGVRRYLNKFKYGNAVTEDLWQALDEETGTTTVDGSSVSVQTMMEEWIKQPGFPVVTVARLNNNDANQYVVSQQRFCTKGSASAMEESKDSTGSTGSTPDTMWTIPLHMRTVGVADNNVHTQRHLFATANETIASQPLMLINSGRVGFFRVNYSLPLLKELAPHVHTLPASDRLGLVSDAVALSAAGICSIQHFTHVLLPHYANEEELSVLQELRDGISSLLKIHGHHANISAYLHALALSIFKSKADVLGWETKTNEPSTDAVKRAVVLGMCVTAEDPSTLAVCREKFDCINVDTFATEGIDLAPELLGLVCIACIRNDRTDKTWTKIMQLHAVATLAADKRTFQSALGSAKDTALMLATLDWAVNSGMVRNQNIFVPVAAVGRTDAKRQHNVPSVMWDWFTQVYETLVAKKLASSLLNSILGSVLQFVRTKEDETMVKEWLAQNKASSDMVKTFDKAMEKIEIVISRREREESVLLELSK